MSYAAILSDSLKTLSPLFGGKADYVADMNGNITKIWGSTMCGPLSPVTITEICPAIEDDSLCKLDKRVVEMSGDEGLLQGKDVEIAGFREAVEVMRPHERFTMAKLAGTFSKGRPYYTCPAAPTGRKDIWDYANFDLKVGERMTVGNGGGSGEVEVDEDEGFLREAHRAMVEGIGEDCETDEAECDSTEQGEWEEEESEVWSLSEEEGEHNTEQGEWEGEDNELSSVSEEDVDCAAEQEDLEGEESDESGWSDC